MNLKKRSMGFCTCKINNYDIFSHSVCPYKYELCLCILLWNYVPSSFEVVQENVQITVINVWVLLSCVQKNKIYPNYNLIHLSFFLKFIMMSPENAQWNSEIIMYSWDYIGLCAILFMAKSLEMFYSVENVAAGKLLEWKNKDIFQQRFQLKNRVIRCVKYPLGTEVI